MVQRSRSVRKSPLTRDPVVLPLLRIHGYPSIPCPCRSQAPFNEACRLELEAQQEWLRYREIQASGTSLSCCLSAVGHIHANHTTHILRPQKGAHSYAERIAHVHTRSMEAPSL